MSTSLLWLVLTVAPWTCLAHKRLLYPMPRSGDGNTGTAPNQNAPCGGFSFENALEAGRTTELRAGSTVKVMIYEQIHHAGQPMRLAISSPNMEDFEDCIWLNHVPQHTLQGAMNLTIELKVPDMTCRNCTLQLMGFEVQNRDNADCCAYHDQFNRTCPLQQYYSCANIDIVGGSRPRSEVCRQPNDWAFRDYKCNYYRELSSVDAWSEQSDGTLKLKTSGSIDGMMAADTHCGNSPMEMELMTECNAMLVAEEEETFTLVQGGEMEAGGIVAIILVVVVGAGVAGTYFLSKNKGDAVDTTGRDHF